MPLPFYALLPRAGHGVEHVLLMAGIALNRAYEQRHKIMPAPQLHVDAAPRLFRQIAAAHHGVVKKNERQHQSQRNDGDDNGGHHAGSSFPAVSGDCV